ncbi:MAG TPA: hypothetical protein VMW27_23900 [Thermoanaerobaculia bacterium]|nr:hypothetical protein [Thermoanaerobaculia bacterium]
MNGGSTRQKALLWILGMVVLFALWHLLAPADDTDSTPSPSSVDLDAAEDTSSRRLSGARRRRGDKEPVNHVEELRLVDLDLVPQDYTPGRDPWRFREPPPAPEPVIRPDPQPAGPTPEELERQRQQMLEQQRIAAEIAANQPPPPPQPPTFPYTYIGNFGPAGNRIAVFTDEQTKTTMNRKESETLDGKFIVARIGYESVDIQFIGFPDAPAHRVAVGRR